jgi:hypothetical protein
MFDMQFMMAAVLVGALTRTAIAQEAAPGGWAPELVVDIDVNDEVCFRERRLTKEDVRGLVQDLARQGVRTIIVRCGFLGILPYRTKLSYPMRFDEEHAGKYHVTIAGDVESYIRICKERATRYAEVIRDFNPPELFIREGHKHGMKVLMWIDLFDDGVSGWRSKFLDEHPHCRWVAKDGKTFFHGLTDYSWPEARRFRKAQVEELLALGADGIHCSTSAHSRHLRHEHVETDFYGYSQPVVDAFKKKHGVDILTAESFDREAWHDLKGQAMVDLYRELSAVCHARNKQFWIGLQLGRYTQFTVAPHFSANVVARYSNHWKTLVDEGIADAFVLGDYEQVSSPGSAYWREKKDIRLAQGQDLYGWAREHYGELCRGRTRLYLFSEWLPGNRQQLADRVDFFAEKVLKHKFDGLDMHEAFNFEFDPAKLALLGKVVKRFHAEHRLPPTEVQAK